MTDCIEPNYKDALTSTPIFTPSLLLSILFIPFRLVFYFLFFCFLFVYDFGNIVKQMSWVEKRAILFQ